MKHGKALVVVLKLIVVVLVVVAGSILSSTVWKEGAEGGSPVQSIVFDETMTLAEFGKRNSIPRPVLKKTFGLQSRKDLQALLGSLPLAEDEVRQNIRKNMALHAEQGSKNWKKILVKFGCWIVFLFGVFLFLRTSSLGNGARVALYAVATLIFGVILGADPGPMGTIKDAITLFGAERVIFPPRMIALCVFLLMVVVANKFICSWGCQVGVLQDLLFRMNRSGTDKPILRQYRVPFVISNTIRIVFFLIFAVVAIAWAFDIIAPIDPFKIFKPKALGIVGSASVGVILLASAFIYRPWCHFFCPFGLLGWFLERISIFKISVDYSKCIACEACTKACPSTVMDSILKREKTIPDCFSCGSCIAACPTKAIRFRAGKRERPPEGKFAGNAEQQSPTGEHLETSPEE